MNTDKFQMLLNRYKNLRLIQRLDPVQDHCRIYYLMNGYEFPCDMMRSLEIFDANLLRC
ncbi:MULTISPECIES: hypothetical protein [unclassified Nostoc]|uniref:hypothetical protein n=1 Tax=unclassified Nostoc TaxID=2593658 RepID=UPI002AD4A05B|nr:hypothetical protein [Nostoc sp. DedQUE03]MDZ7976338.1 hypothetical protein [Nostoc sp. DedQUE03]